MIQSVKRSVLVGLVCLLGSGAFSAFGQNDLVFQSFGEEAGFSSLIPTYFFQDRAGFLWIATADGLFRYDGYTFEEYRRGDAQIGTLKSNVFTGITQDNAGNIWVSTEGGGISIQDATTGLFRLYGDEGFPDLVVYELLTDREGKIWVASKEKGLYRVDPQADTILQRYYYVPGQEEGLASSYVYSLLEDQQGRIWAGTVGGGLSRIDYQAGEVTTYLHEKGGTGSLSNNQVNCLFETPDGQLWVGTEDGLNLWNEAEQHFERWGQGPDQSLTDQNVKAIALGPEGRLWVGTRSGLNAINLSSGEVDHFFREPDQPTSLADDRITALFLDRQDLLWIGSWTKVINRLDYGKKRFVHWSAEATAGPRLSDNDIKPIHQTAEQVLWVGTQYQGVNRIDRKSGTNQIFTEANGLSHNTVYALEEDEQGMWIGTSDGLNYYHRPTERLYVYPARPEDPEGIPHRIIWSICRDADGTIWLGTGGGLSRIAEHVPGKVLRVHNFFAEPGTPRSLSGNSIKSIYEDEQGGLWVGTENGGLNFFDRETEVFTHYQHDPNDPGSIIGDYIYCINSDERGDIWVGTPTGASRLDRASGTFTHLTEKEGLPNSFVFGILPDANGNLWMSTNRGLFRYDPASGKHRTYLVEDGLPGNVFNNTSYFADPHTGEFFFGGTNGLVSFAPEGIAANDYPPPTVLTHFHYFNPKRSDTQAIPVPAINNRSAYVLSYRDNILSFEFAALNFLQPEKNRYRYQLQGFNNEWFDLGDRRELTFTNLDPGKYVLRIQGTNNEGVPGEIKELEITITPPWYQTLWAQILFWLAGLALVYGLYRFQLHRRLEVAEKERLKELDAVKNKFFTNITHEFRTPLTVIMGMAGLLKGQDRENALIQRNSRQMLNLVNQMLDLRRLESQALPVNMVQADIVPYARTVYESFLDYAAERNIEMHFLPNQPTTIMDFDPDKILRIFSNLLSNAIKYNRPGGTVYFQMDKLEIDGELHFGMKVKDTGYGIAEEKLPYVFERFYRVEKDKDAPVKEGSGIGLSLTKELVNYFDGSITVRSTLGEGSTFTVLLPITREAEVGDPAQFRDFYQGGLVATSMLNTKEDEWGEELWNEEEDKSRILVIEDNLDVAEYLRTCLEPYFRVSLAIDGEMGINQALEQLPDIILSDVMMPKKDGFEVLSVLKKDERTNHIPIIMLSAKSDVEARLEGLDLGADAYLAKPFHPEELLLYIRNQLLTRKTLQERYRAQMRESTVVDPPTLDPFLKKARLALLEHLDDEAFGPEELAQALHISRSQLHNKLKQLTGESTTRFMNQVRVQAGRERLLQTDDTISEIAFAVGFRDPGYFSSRYKAYFGESPTQTRESGIPS